MASSSTTPEQFGCYFENPVWETETCDGVTAALRDVAKHVATLEGCEEGIYTQAEDAQTVDMVLEDDGEASNMTESENDALVDEENDAWSVISEEDQEQRLYCDDADDESEVDGAENDGDADEEEQPYNPEEDEELYGGTDDGEEHLDNTLTNDDEEEHVDDCTEESIQVRELKEQLVAFGQESWEYQCDLEKRHREELDYELETCKKEALKSKSELEKRHRKELEDLNREHGKELNCLNTALQEKMQHVDMCREEIYRRRAFEVSKSQQLEVIKRQHKTECDKERKRADEAEQQLKDTLQEMQDKHQRELEELKRKQHQKYEDFAKAAAEEVERYRQKAARDAKLCEDASEVLAAQITKAEVMKTEYEKRLKDANSRYEQEIKRGHADREWLAKQTCEVLEEKNKVNNENLKLRKELAEAVDDIQELVQKVRTDKAGHDQEIVRLKEEAQRQHEQAFDELVDEHEQDCAELADHLWEAENEIDELRQKEQDMEAKHKQEMSQAKAAQICLEGQVFDLMCKLVDVKQEAAGLRDQLVNTKCEIQELKDREQELMSQQGADRAMFERSLHAMRKALQDSE
ncbi:hypothetical protein KCU81_g3858, partial [Aureobasidium melanogenum]|uniref:Uncharacterized protein n=1 Tax=Aureobasidium melanogenum (strain CBS 110374) TaxID=1043003 RepID=A0A074VQ43_AURM1